MKRILKTFLLVFGLSGLMLILPAVGQQTPPRDVGLREETSRRLVQLDVSVTGPDEAIRSLVPGDFELSVAGRFIDDFTLVSETEIGAGVSFVVRNHHTLVEGAAGVAVAAFQKQADEFAGKNVVIVLCGANIDAETLKSLL